MRRSAVASELGHSPLRRVKEAQGQGGLPPDAESTEGEGYSLVMGKSALTSDAPVFFGDNGDRPAGRREARKETILTECSLSGFRYRCAGDGDAD